MLHLTRVSDTLVFSRRRPRRTIFLPVVRNHALINGIILSLTIGASVGPYAPWVVSAWIICYWVYKLARPLVFTPSNTEPSPTLSLRDIFRLLSITLSATFLIAYVYIFTDYVKDNGISNTIWLIYILPIFITIQSGRNILVVVSVATSIAAIICINIYYVLLVSQLSMRILVSSIVAESLWLTLISFMLYVLVRIINDRSANLRLLHDIGNELMGVPAAADEPALFQAIVDKIVKQFPYSHIFIFLLQEDKTLTCAASSSAEGTSLVKQGFHLSSKASSSLGIVRLVLETGKIYYTNDVQHDSFYQYHPLLDDTRSELAIPIRIDDTIVGVLDIQDRHYGAFLAQDSEIMSLLADHIGRVLDNITSLQSIVRSVARRFMVHHELHSTLDDIARAAHDELKADLVLVFQVDPEHQHVELAGRAGTIQAPEQFDAMIAQSCPIVDRLLIAEKGYYSHNLHQEITDPILRWAKRHIQKYALFEREQIVSFATLRFRANDTHVGMMFLLFRKPRDFSEREKGKFSVFADLAALAIQKAQIHQRQIIHQRRDLAMQLHDEIMANAFGISKLISALQLEQNLSERQYARLSIMQEAIQELTRNTKHLHESWNEVTPVDLWVVVDRIAADTRMLHGVDLDVVYDQNYRIVQSHLVQHLRRILKEAISNAVKHGDATLIRLKFEVVQQKLSISIEDNGCGFELTSRTGGSGITNMQERAKQLKGSCKIDSSPGQGTHISFVIPL